jgi:hypothetical protein
LYILSPKVLLRYPKLIDLKMKSDTSVYIKNIGADSITVSLSAGSSDISIQPLRILLHPGDSSIISVHCTGFPSDSVVNRFILSEDGFGILDTIALLRYKVNRVPEGPPAIELRTYRLYNNFPNPFNPGTRVLFSLQEPSKVTMRIFDILGRTVAFLVEEAYFDDGLHELSWIPARTVDSGTYFLSLSARSVDSPSEYHSTVRMIYIK